MDAKRASIALSRIAGSLVLAAAVAACGSGLDGSEWLWCKEHLAAVDAAAESLQTAKAQTTYQEPSWWPDYVTSGLSFNNAVLAASPAFTSACNAAAETRGVGESRLQWCMTDGIGDVWDASIQFGLMVDMSAQTFAYTAIPLSKRIDNQDFVRACRSAYAARTS